MTEIIISGTGLYTPAYQITNAELVESFNRYVEHHNKRFATDIKAGKISALKPSSSEFILKASGIQSRYVMDKQGILDIQTMHPVLPQRADDQPSIQCEIAVQAAEQALANANKSAEEIDLVLCACSNMQRAYPAISIEVQQALGISGYAYDLNVACSSATFAIDAACNAIKNHQARAVLIINPEICSGHLNFQDRDSHFIFGDACTAMVVENKQYSKSQDYFKILGCLLKTKFSNNIRNNFGFLTRAETSDHEIKEYLFVQNGRKVFKEVVPMVVNLIRQHVDLLNLNLNDFQRFWLHQANYHMNHMIGQKLLGEEYSEEKVPSILEEYANTSSAGSIIVFHKFHQDLPKNTLGLICSFGAGYSVGNVIVEKQK
ncbi:MAG: beta-ketoacyl-ACP synthase III [Pseudomonadota bacterium]